MMIENFLTITAALPEACFFVSGTGEILATNPVAEHMLGVDKATLQGQQITTFLIDPEEKVLSYIRLCLRNKSLIPGALTWRGVDGGPIESYSRGVVIEPKKPHSFGSIILRSEPKGVASSRFNTLNRSLEQLTASYHKLEAQSVALRNEITERKQAEEEIRRLNESLEQKITQLMKTQRALEHAIVRAEGEKAKSDAIIAAIGDGVSIQGTDFRVLYQNPVFEKLVGKHVGEICYKEFKGRDSVCEECPCVMSFRDGKIHTAATHLCRGEEPVYLEITASPLRNVAGTIIAAIEIIRNVTERKKAEDALRESEEELKRHRDSLEELTNANEQLQQEITDRKRAEGASRKSEERFRAMVETISDWVWEIDQNGIYTYTSPKVRELLGYESEEVIGKSPFDLMPPDEAKRVAGLFGEIIGSRKPIIGLENVTQHKDGQCVVLETSGVPIFDTKGNFLGYRGIDRDITERKRAEEALKESEQKFRTLFEKSIHGILAADLETMRFSYANPSICRMFGYSETELLALGVNDIHPKESLDQVMPEFELQMRGEKSMASGLPCLRKDGTVFYADVNAAGIIIDGRECMMGFFADVTERKRAEEEVNRLNEKLEEKVEERTRQLFAAQQQLIRKEKLAILGQLAGIVGHELRNPLGVMNNAVYFLQTVMTDADDTVTEYLDIIKQEIDNSQRIITDLLDFARTKTPQPRQVMVRALTEESLSKCSVPDNIDVQTNIPDTLPCINVDPFQVGQIFQNLITNAVQAMPEGGVLRIAARQLAGVGNQVPGDNDKEDVIEGETADSRFPILDPGFVEISVTDNGEGISPENMEKLFQPLFTTKTTGIGLGLVVCKNLIEANGGSIGVESESGKGSVFILTLPLEKKKS